VSADNAVDSYFAPDSPIELLLRSKLRLERLVSADNAVDSYFAPDSPIEF